MSALGVGAAMLLPVLVAWAAGCALMGRPRGDAAWAASLGTAWFVGAVGWGWALTWLESVATATLFADFAPWLVGIVLLVSLAAWYWAPESHLPSAPPTPSSSPAERVVIASAAALLSVTAVILWQQAQALPTLTWDAWNAWLAKSKAWYFAGQFLPVRSLEEWLATTPGSALTTTAWSYPEALPRYVVWLASASGGWNEASVHLAWPLTWIALGLGCYGLLSQAGCRRVVAVVATAGLLTLPLITAHAALAGYMDLWLAGMLMLAGAYWLRWHRTRHWSDALVATVCALLLPAIKPEGAIWLLCLGAATVLVLVPRWLRWTLVVAGPLLWAAALPFGGWRLPVPGLGMVRLGWGEIELPVRGVTSLHWRPVLDDVAQTLFLMPNWSLLWYLAPVVVLLRAGVLRRAPDLAGLGWFISFGYGFLALLFFFTDAAAWAENLTSINRVLMHIVPLTVVWLTLLWVRGPAPRDTAPATHG